MSARIFLHPAITISGMGALFERHRLVPAAGVRSARAVELVHDTPPLRKGFRCRACGWFGAEPRFVSMPEYHRGEVPTCPLCHSLYVHYHKD